MSMQHETHGPSTGSYLVGFILAVFFTLASFIPVMYGMMASWAISTKVIYLIGMALIQMAVQIVFFLHLNTGPDAKWNLSALWFAVVCVFIIVGGTWWAISHLNYNMMGGSGRVVEPEMLERDSSASAKTLSDTQKEEERLSDDPQIPSERIFNTQAPAEEAPAAEMPIETVPDTENSTE
ncbi:cytochrome o ubiquinol oxidase operon protein cyoD [Bartonella silvatica]|uniref:Cytochrome bo(3) ubiquinol oxidase subunit 4 n=1 Tax=Bartonella silvatica TaxID=357760 RepID=A0ABV2HEU6_9HYPH